MYKRIIFAISDYTLIPSKKSIRPFAYGELLLLLVILVHTSPAMNTQNATHAMLHLPAD